MPSKESVKAVNALLEEQAQIQRELTEIETARLEASDKQTDKLRGRLQRINQELKDQKDSGGLSTLGKSVESMLPSVNSLVGFASRLHDGLTRTNREAVGLAVNFGRISLAEATKSQVAFQDSATRLAVATGTTFDAIKAKVGAVADATSESQDEIYAYARSTMDVSGGFDAALERARGLSKESRELGLTFAEATGELGAGMAGALKPGEGFGVLRSIAAEADKLGTVGGPRALEMQLAALGHTMRGMSAKDLKDAGAFFGTVTKGLDPERAKEVQARIAGTLKGRAADIQRFSGVEVLNEQGELDASKLPAAIRKMQSRIPARDREYVMSSIFGDAQTGRLLARADLSDANMKRIAGAEALPYANRLAATDVGKSIEAQRTEEKAQRERGEREAAAARRIQTALAGMSPESRDTVSTLAEYGAKAGISSTAMSRAIGGEGKERLAGIASAGLQVGNNPAVAQLLDAIRDLSGNVKANKDQAIEVKVLNASDAPVAAVATKKGNNAGHQ